MFLFLRPAFLLTSLPARTGNLSNLGKLGDHGDHGDSGDLPPCNLLLFCFFPHDPVSKQAAVSKQAPHLVTSAFSFLLNAVLVY